MSQTAVALSGGADSLMALLSLREMGEDVFAVHGLFTDRVDKPLFSRLDALCARLGVPLHCLDLRADFERLVVAPFVQAYQRGLTPNPCASCNPLIKFGLLLDRAQELGAERLATGHYVRLETTARGPALFRGADKTKDQSYFLSRVPTARLGQIVFPLGGWTKTEVRAALGARSLTPPAERESQDICFIEGDYRTFLHARGVALSGPGPITLTDGTLVGEHQGLWRYTLGQRKGMGVAFREPLYAVAKDVDGNRLIVGPREDALAIGCKTGAPNLLFPPELWPRRILVQCSYRQSPAPAHVEIHGQGMDIRFESPRTLPSPGQVAAVYSSEGQVLAGAVISEALHAD